MFCRISIGTISEWTREQGFEIRRALGEPLDSTVNCLKKAEPDLTGFEGIELRIVHVRFG
jgi:hypothetical protein